MTIGLLEKLFSNRNLILIECQLYYIGILLIILIILIVNYIVYERLNNMGVIDSFKLLFNNKDLILDLTKREVENRYKGSFLGRLWIIFNHLSLICIYTFVFGFVFETKMNTSLGEIGLDFALWLYCGMLPWFFLNESLTLTVKDIVSKVNYVKKIVFPLETLPIVTVIVAFMNMIIGLALLFVGLLLFGHTFEWTMLLYLLILPPLVLFVSGLSLIISSLGVYFRDLAQVIGLISMLWMYATPILYNVEMVPDEFLFLSEYNILHKIVEYCRDVLFWNNAPDFTFLLWFYPLSLALYILGFVVFRKLKKGFSDVL